jgi:hypothetical protein
MIKHYLILLLVACAATAQNDTKFIIGQWTIISIGDSEIFYDSRTRDIKLLDTSKTPYMPEQLAAMKERIETMFVKNTYEFGEDGKAVLNTGLGGMTSKFSVDEKEKHIVVTGKGPSDEEVKEVYKYEIVGKNLLLKIPISDDTLIVTLGKSSK